MASTLASILRGTATVAAPIAAGAAANYATTGDTSLPQILFPGVTAAAVSGIPGLVLGRRYNRELKGLIEESNRSRSAWWNAAKAHGVYGKDGKLLKPDDMEPVPAEGFAHRIRSTGPDLERLVVLKDMEYRGKLAPDLKASLRDAEHQYATSRRSRDNVNHMMQRFHIDEQSVVNQKDSIRIGKNLLPPLGFATGSGLGAISGVYHRLGEWNAAQQDTSAALGDATSGQDELAQRQSITEAPISATRPATNSVSGERVAKGVSRSEPMAKIKEVLKGPPDPNSRESVLAANAAKAKQDAADRLATKQDKPIVSDFEGTKTPPPVKSEIPWGKIGLGVAGVGAAGLLAAYLYNHFNKPKKKKYEDDEG